MTYTGQFAVSYALDALSAPEDVTGYVEQAQLTVGRKRIIDRWQPSELTVTLIDPTTTDPLVVGGFLV
jgi:ligand-binding sensor domain-containing protein